MSGHIAVKLAVKGLGDFLLASSITDPSYFYLDSSPVLPDLEPPATTHSHGTEGEHAHEGLAFTTWLDLSLAAKQAEAVFEALARKQPQQKDLFRANYLALEKDLLALDGRIKAIVSLKDTVPIIFSHPVYEYFEKAYGLNGRSVHWEPDQDPTPGQVTELNKLLENHLAKWMIWEATPIKSAVDVLEAKGIQNVVFDPCGKMPFDSDFLTVMQQNVSNFELVFR